MTSARRNNSFVKSVGFSLLGLGLVTTGIAIAPIVPAAHYQTEQIFEKIKMLPQLISEERKQSNIYESTRLPVNRDRTFSAGTKEQAFNLIGAVEAATITAQDESPESTAKVNNSPAQQTPKQTSPLKPAIPSTNAVTISAANIQMNIIEGTDAKSALNHGAWHIPGTSSPDKGGNTVLSCHRYLYTRGPNVSKNCYHLDKLKIGDVIEITWDGKIYKYRVFEEIIVKPNAIEILDNTADPILTIFTCHPVYSTKERLVIKAMLIQ